MNARILIADADPVIQRGLAELLQSQGHAIQVCVTDEEVWRKTGEWLPELCLVDADLPAHGGLELLRRLRPRRQGCAFILLGAALPVPEVVAAMRLGANFCLAKPLILKEVEARVREALGERVEQPRPEGQGLVVVSSALRQLDELVRKVARGPATTVLIVGETGTGKEMLARHLHALSQRRQGQFVAVNCAAIPDTLIESELFGHERGAFTDAKLARRGIFEEAQGGTLFLDEIGELLPSMQAKLLRALQERKIRRVGGSRDIPFEARVIAASNSDLVRAVQVGRFREDLYYRLCVVPLCVPALRERPEDIVPLAEHFCRQFAAEFGLPAPELGGEDRQALLAYPWPGNVRELRNCVERAILLETGRIRPSPEWAALPAAVYPPESAQAGAGAEERYNLALAEPSLENAERALINQVMQRVNGNKHLAASLLGINRTTLYRKLNSYGLECPESGLPACQTKP